MCSVASYLKHGELKAMGFVLTGSFSISKLIILKIQLKFSPLPGGNINYFVPDEKPANSGLLNSN